MGEDGSASRATCSEDSCQGVRLQTGDRCLAHADGQDRDAELKRFAEEGRLDARGVPISAELLDRILDAAPPDEDRPNRPRLTEVNFDGAEFGEGSAFRGATFADNAWFRGASFGDHASFKGAYAPVRSVLTCDGGRRQRIWRADTPCSRQTAGRG